jgi:hypothetical protein
MPAGQTAENCVLHHASRAARLNRVSTAAGKAVDPTIRHNCYNRSAAGRAVVASIEMPKWIMHLVPAVRPGAVIWPHALRVFEPGKSRFFQAKCLVELESLW